MEPVLAWGLDVVQAVQTIANPVLTEIMKVLTLAGSEYFYLLALPVIFWCFDERFGVRFGLIVLGSAFLNSWLKVVFRQPRPFDLDPGVALSHESSYGLPSGHSQGTAVFWGLLAPKIRKPWGLLLAILMPLVIGFTRIYLGVHFPTDLFLGWFLGWGIALAWFFFGHGAENFLGKANIRVKVILAAVAALGMNALLPEETNLSGVFFGTAVGAAFMFDKVGFDARAGSPWQKLARLGLGLAGLAMVYVGGKLVSPDEGQSLYALARFVRYGLVGVWTSLGAPWVFVSLKLGSRRSA
ncbi:MAG: phosphatase PAP2 family protein [Spirochaetia bacterium]|nr:phosphatase PAP2 family protein [Spirochaetia bacterium]